MPFKFKFSGSSLLVAGNQRKDQLRQQHRLRIKGTTTEQNFEKLQKRSVIDEKSSFNFVNPTKKSFECSDR